MSLSTFKQEHYEQASKIASEILKWDLNEGCFWNGTDSLPYLPITVDGMKLVPFNDEGKKLRKELGKDVVDLFKPMSEHSHLQFLIDIMLNEEFYDIIEIVVLPDNNGKFFSKLIQEDTEEIIMEHEFGNTEEETIFMLILNYYGQEIK